MYAEFLAYDYAADLMKEKGYPEAASYITYEKHCRSSLLCLYALCDLMIHYNGAGEPQIAKVLDAFGIQDPASAHAIYDYITDSPTNYLKYYLGYLEVLSLKENAKKLWGTDYSDLKFHTFYLEMGPADFDSLHAQLGQYAENR